MIQYEKISKIQSAMLFTAFLSGDSAIFNLVSRDTQNSWISYIVGWMGGLLLIYLYIKISALYNHRSLIGILKNCFGKYLGTMIGIGYIWYFFHIAALVSRNYSDFLSFTNYFDTPDYFIIAVILLIVLYALKKGLMVTARSSEFFVPLFILIAIIISFTAAQFYRIKYFFPLWQWHVVPMLQDSFTILTFPFGESIVFLMIFPSIANLKSIKKASFAAFLIAGVLILNIIIRNLLILGSHMIPRQVYPIYTTIALTYPIDVGIFSATDLSISCIYKTYIMIYAAVLAISEIFDLKDYKNLALPAVLLVNVLSNLVFKETHEMYNWFINIRPYYSVLFQIIIPLFILGISLIKKGTGWLQICAIK